ncbi:MAG: MoaD/ThiS family protein [Candidatus Hodarchaeota archaeon]
MPIKVVLFGDLNDKGFQKPDQESKPATFNMQVNGIKNVYDILEKLNIKESEISHIYVNYQYSGPGKEVKDGARVALFPRRMAIMFAEIPHLNSIEVMVKLFADLRKYGPEKSITYVPEGSTTRKIIEKYNIPKKEGNLIILINGIPCHSKNCILKAGDVIAIFPPLAGG